MKKNYLRIVGPLAVTILLIAGCQKETQQATASKLAPELNSQSATKELSETETLIRKWTEWVFSRDLSLVPWDDATGAKQYADQPYASGTMMLAGSGSTDLVYRAVTISLAQYQNVFVPLVNTFNYWNDCYPGHPENNVPNGGISNYLTEALNGKRTLILSLDGNSLLPDKLKDLRANSGFWEFPIHSSWDGGCVATSTTFYADGFWSKVALTPGVHTLEIAGDLEFRRFKLPFSNHVIYTITVTN